MNDKHRCDKCEGTDLRWVEEGVWEALCCQTCGATLQLGRRSGTLPSFLIADGEGFRSSGTIAEQYELAQQVPAVRKLVDMELLERLVREGEGGSGK